ncbi:HAMP domain-containing histidine kinase [Oxynema sp. CENA135]|uniref:sensor histidine kinase n=1 Tax=Oxynema sp. CENA135 TaxID=984206 RepID=UPI00190DDAE1|nr:HAMP domain-containing sensor histidine kinase [Oxynema sp. CENA135]MBK4731525.1 HAMP domain-containing histidine kinase [Oxynema sp. CENA135]
MNWSNWLYLATGLGIGLALHRWVPSRPQATESDTSADGPAPEDEADRASLVRQLEHLQLQYQMAVQMCQFRAGFLSRVSHELRAPINGLIGSHQLILEGLCDNPEEEREFLGKANTSALKIIEILDRILDVARTQEGRTPMTLKVVPLGEILAKVRELTTIQAANRNIGLKIGESDPNWYVRADRHWLTQVLVNAIDMAITPVTPGDIRVSVEEVPARDDRPQAPHGDLKIAIDTYLPLEYWSEPIDFLHREQTADCSLMEDPELSAGMNLWLDITLLELMSGKLEILPLPASAAPNSGDASLTPGATRLQCLIPRAIPTAGTDS